MKTRLILLAVAITTALSSCTSNLMPPGYLATGAHLNRAEPIGCSSVGPSNHKPKKKVASAPVPQAKRQPVFVNVYSKPTGRVIRGQQEMLYWIKNPSVAGGMTEVSPSQMCHWKQLGYVPIIHTVKYQPNGAVAVSTRTF
jgi:hypothetical protein